VTFHLRDHTADVAVEAEAETLSGVFAAVADGLAAAMCDEIPDADDGDESVEFTVTAESREALLFDYLDQLIYERDVRGVLPVDNEARVSPLGTEREETGETDTRTDADEPEPGREDEGESESGGRTDREWRVEGRARGVLLSEVDAREIKAVTYSEMRLERGERGWEAYVVFDV
jgi:SHS2 domain-containing protein